MGSGKEHSQVLICPPIGYEYARCQFFLQMLAEALAGKGIASLRFDFLGMADSAGDSHQATLRRWEADIRDAYAELLRRSAGGKSVVLSLRLTSALAFRALQGETVDRWVCWDPVADGARHIQELRRMTKEEALKQLVVRNVRMPRVQPGHEELVGSTFARSAIEELANCRFQPDSDEVRRDKIRIVLTEPARIPYGDRYAVDAPCHWYDSRKATSAITSSTLLASLLSALTEETV